MARPYQQSSIDQLEAAFDRRRSEERFLRQLLAELEHRSTARARALKMRAVTALGVAPKAQVTGREVSLPPEAPIAPAVPSPAPYAAAAQLDVETLNLSTRAANALAQRNITTLTELAELTEIELLRQPNVGRTTLAELRSLLHDHGHSFRDSRGSAGRDDTRLSSEELRARQLAQSIRVDGAPLSARAEALLRRHGVRYLGALAALWPDELIREPNVGRTTIAELRTLLDRQGLAFGIDVGDWTPELADSLGAQAEAWAASRDGDAHPSDATTPKSTPPDPEDLPGALLDRLRRAGANERNLALVAHRQGWDGNGGATLDETGQIFGMTRERVRQISKKLLSRLSRQPAPAALLRALDEITEVVPTDAASLTDRLAGAHLTPREFRLAGIRTAAEAFGLTFPFVFALDGRLVLREGADEVLDRARVRAGRLSGRRGCVHVADLPELSEVLGRRSPLIRSTLEALGFEWLSDDGWFWRADQADSGRNRLVNNIQQAMAAANRLDVAELRSAVRRHHRMHGFAPPTPVLLEICRRLPWLCVEERTIISLMSPQGVREVLNPTSAVLLDILRESGPLLDRSTLLEYGLARGLNENSFNIYLSYSPVIWRPAPGLYATVGAELPPGVVETWRPTPNAPTHVLDSGWRGPQVRVSWRLERGALLSGILTLPTGFARVLEGRHALQDAAGGSLGGVTVQDRTVWPLRRTFRQLGAETGDVVELKFDPAARICRVRVGDLEQIEAEPVANEENEADDRDE